MIPDGVLNPSAPIERFGSVEVGDGRTIVARIAPFGVDARVRDGDGPEYVERIVAGAFRRQTRDPARVPILLNYEHREGLGDQIGRATDLVERDDGLHGTFVALSTPFGDQGLDLIRAGIVGLSLQGVRSRGRVSSRRTASSSVIVSCSVRRAHRVARLRGRGSRRGPFRRPRRRPRPRRALAALDYVESRRAQSPVAQ